MDAKTRMLTKSADHWIRQYAKATDKRTRAQAWANALHCARQTEVVPGAVIVCTRAARPTLARVESISRRRTRSGHHNVLGRKYNKTQNRWTQPGPLFTLEGLTEG